MNLLPLQACDKIVTCLFELFDESKEKEAAIHYDRVRQMEGVKW
ncbi:hypothetical protein WMZ97_01535 [Lentibacillus sp. N15]